MAGLLAFPMIGLAGVVIDFGFSSMAIGRMNLAADAAALAAAKTAATAYSSNSPTYILQGQAAGQSWFKAQAGTTSGLSMPTPSVQVTQNGSVFTANVAFNGSMATTLGRVLGVNRVPVGGTASATISVSGYSDIEIMMDMSSSMGIAATQAGITQLGALTQPPNNLQQGNNGAANQGQPCAFGCHWDVHNNDFYGLARTNKIQLRIDVLLGAVSNVLTTLVGADTQSQFRVGLYAFNSTFQTIFGLSGNIQGAIRAQSAVAVPLINPNAVEGDTYFPAAMTAITALTQIAGNGTTAALPRKYVFLITDGVQDYVAPGGTRLEGPINPSVCDALKAKGVTLMVLYTEYFPLTSNKYYNDNIAPTASQIQPNLQSCASPGYFYYATDAASIQTALNQMMAVATATQGRFVQ